MSIDVKELISGGSEPVGPVSAWPKDRHEALIAQLNQAHNSGRSSTETRHDLHVKAQAPAMAKGVLRAAGQFIQHGKVSNDIREERYAICKSCPHFIEDSKRCSECGCFMEAKTWIGGDPKLLCPKKKWER